MIIGQLAMCEACRDGSCDACKAFKKKQAAAKPGARDIALHYSTIDRFSKSAKFKTLAGAQKFAQKYMGKHPDVSLQFGYAVSDSGTGKLTVRGATFAELFPSETSAPQRGVTEDYGDEDC